MTKITDTLHKDQCTFTIIPRSVLLRMIIFSDKSCRESRNPHFTFNNIFRKSCHLWDNIEKYRTAGQATDDIWRMRIAGWITKATITNSEYTIFIAFPLQQWFTERASMSLYMYTACLVGLILLNWSPFNTKTRKHQMPCFREMLLRRKGAAAFSVVRWWIL
jgi:hypothetical protein